MKRIYQTSNNSASRKLLQKTGAIFTITVLVLLLFQMPLNLSIADEHKNERRDAHNQEIKERHAADNDHDKKYREKEDDGNEITGEIVFFLLFLANLTIFLSLIAKGAKRSSRLSDETKDIIRKINQFQKKYLMRFHYILNPLALCIAFLHFLLSSCRTTALPELGLLFMTVIIVFGLMLKFNIAPKWMRKFVCRLHTGIETSSILIIVLVIGHLVVD